jgi:hypothetical protein
LSYYTTITFVMECCRIDLHRLANSTIERGGMRDSRDSLAPFTKSYTSQSLGSLQPDYSALMPQACSPHSKVIITTKTFRTKVCAWGPRGGFLLKLRLVGLDHGAMVIPYSIRPFLRPSSSPLFHLASATILFPARSFTGMRRIDDKIQKLA